MKEPFAVNSTLSHYVIIKKLGAGGMGEVYLARDTKLERSVAIKLLPARYTEDADRVRRFVQEAKAASALNHPNIIVIHEIGELDRLHFIVTEFVEGRTLRQQISGLQKLPTVLDIVIQVAGALSAAHAAGIVHRDVKPENIMLRSDGYVKVLDFGLAKLTEPTPSTLDTEAPTIARVDTETGTVMGTARYMSPEQARGLKVDARSDVFSLGVVLYEIVAGQPPFAGETNADVIASILGKDPLPLSRFVSEVPAALERIIAKALRKDFEERYQTIKDLLIDLKDLKQEIEFSAKLARSTHSLPDRPDVVASGALVENQVTPMPAQDTAWMTPHRTTSSAEYLIGEIKRHKVVSIFTLVVLTAVIATLTYFSSVRSGGPIDSLAVLPFVNVGADPNTEYLSDGITDSLINVLSRLPKLKVMSRNSVFRYKEDQADAQKAGRTLGVRAVLTGKVAQRGQDLIVTAELVDVRDNSHLWGEQYNRKLSDLIQVQGELSRDISENLRLRLSGEDKQQLTKRGTESAEAYELYLKGRYYLNSLTAEGRRNSVDYFQRAIAKDPRYGPAYAGLAEYYALFVYANTASDFSPKEASLKAKETALKAVELDETLAEAHTALAMIATLFEWDWKRADRELQRAIAINPNYVPAHHFYSHYLLFVGQFAESFAEGQRALALDPLDVGMNFHLGWYYYFTHQYDRAGAQLQRVVEMNPNFPDAHSMLGMVYAQQGRYQEAIAELQRSREGGSDQRGKLGRVYAISGQRGEAQKLLDQLQEESKQKYVSPYNIAIIYEGLGDKEQMFRSLEKAYAERDSNIVHVKVEPDFESLHSDPRFADLLRRIGLPE
jgi:eukaryotic-like serine/threonine-protein kinase